MDIKSYIESGMLEAYVMGVLPEAQMNEVAMHAAKHSEIRDEISRIEEAMETLAISQQVAVDPTIEDQLIDSVTSRSPGSKGETAHPIDGSNSNSVFKLLTGILGITSLALGGMLYQSQQTQSKQAIALSDCESAQIEYAANINKISTELNDIEQGFAITADPSYRKVALGGTDQAPQASCIVYWNESNANLYLRVNNLKELAANQQYQLWAIIDGKPVDAGVFDFDENYLIEMKSTAGVVSTFAVTIEPRGGSESPALETMQVAGNL